MLILRGVQMFKVFVLLPNGRKWKVVVSLVVSSEADAKTEMRRLRREHEASQSIVLTFPANEVPDYIPS